MIVLGVTGWAEEGHDASACIVRDGELLVAVEEERFSRTQHAWNQFPHAASQYCLGVAGLSLDDVDHIAFGWDLPTLYTSSGRAWSEVGRDLESALFPKSIFNHKRSPPIHYIAHHAAHAASAFWTSGFERAALLVMDGQGERASATLGQVSRERGVQVLTEIPAACSLGYMYKAASEFVGLGRLNPGKTMGLAAYGLATEGREYAVLEPLGYQMPPITPDTASARGLFADREIMKQWKAAFARGSLSGAVPGRVFESEVGAWNYADPRVMRYRHFAASIQAEVERVALHLVDDLMRETDCASLVFSGGVALNCSLNGKIARHPAVDDLFIFPASGDSGTSIGAAMDLSFNLGCTPVHERLKDAFIGPVFSPTAIRAQLDRYGLRYTEYNDDELAEVIARHISEDRIVAVFSGRGEIGPRALGNRSILASPTSPRIRDKVNDAKGRELWRPLCPSVLANSAKAYFHDASTGSRFMLRSLLVRDERAVEIGGVVHVDGTARAQLVDEDTPFGGLLSLVSDMTGSPMVMNTSFNLAGEPIVGRPVDAIRSFFASPLDVLVLERYVITK